MSTDNCCKPAREWWVVETKTSYFIYEDELTAKKELKSQALSYGYAELHHTKSDYDLLERERDELRLRIERQVEQIEEAQDQKEIHILKAKAWADESFKWRSQVATLAEALRKIASYEEGDVVDGGFDEPKAAKIARAALAKAGVE